MTTQDLDLHVSILFRNHITDGSDPMAKIDHKLSERNDASTAKKLISELDWNSLWSEMTSRQVVGMATSEPEQIGQVLSKPNSANSVKKETSQPHG